MLWIPARQKKLNSEFGKSHVLRGYVLKDSETFIFDFRTMAATCHQLRASRTPALSSFSSVR
jgi:hypothetical protein